MNSILIIAISFSALISLSSCFFMVKVILKIGKLGRQRDALSERLDLLSQNIFQNLQLNMSSQKSSMDSFQKSLEELRMQNITSLDSVRTTLQTSINELNRQNAEKLEKIRYTVDEQLQSTLEKRLGHSFEIVSKRLEEVHKGIGEMQNLATGVGDLKKVLSNIKTRGIWGEVQVENILEQLLTPAQYDKNAKVHPNRAHRVEYAIKIPSKDEDNSIIYIPVDSKFPLEDYQILVNAYETSDSATIKAAYDSLIRRIKLEAKEINEKYIAPPYTTDFAILFVPIEGLYAECLKEPGMIEHLQHKYKVIITGPTTFSAILNSLQLGFRTLAIEKRSGQVWELLSKVKVEFSKFADILSKTKQKLDQASRIIDDAESKTRNIQRKLSKVEEHALPNENPPLKLAVNDTNLMDND